MVETDRKMNDGGPAWPVAHDTMRDTLRPGMSLRDWFAGQALAGILSFAPGGDPRSVTATAYNMADAMLAARKGGSDVG